MTFHDHKGRIGKVGGSLARGVKQRKPKKEVEKKRITRRGGKEKRIQRGERKPRTAQDFGDNPAIRGEPDRSRISLAEPWERDAVKIKKVKKIRFRPSKNLTYFEFRGQLFSIPTSKIRSDERVKALLLRDSVSVLRGDQIRKHERKELQKVTVTVKLKPKLKKEVKKEETYLKPRIRKRKGVEMLPEHVKIRGSGITSMHLAREVRKAGLEFDEVDINAYVDPSLTPGEQISELRRQLNPTFRDMIAYA